MVSGLEFAVLNVATAGTYDLRFDWTDHADVDVYLTDGNFVLSTCADDLLSCQMGTGDQPEVGTVTLDPGTFRVDVEKHTPE